MKSSYPFLAAVALALANCAICRAAAPDLSGAIPFQMVRANTIAFTIGDGGSGPHKAILMGEPSLPTHAIYRPADTSTFGPSLKMPVVLWANGGCRSSSGEFRNFLSEIASHGFIVVAIGPALSAATMGSEAPTNTSTTAQLLDGLDWITRENQRQGSEYFGKIDTSKVAVMGQSCGGVQALEASLDPRITTSVIWNSGVLAATPSPAANLTAAQRKAIATAQANIASRVTAAAEARRSVVAASLALPRSEAEIASAVDSLAAADQSLALAQALEFAKLQASADRLPADQRAQFGQPAGGAMASVTRPMLQKLHAPIAYFIGGPSDVAFNPSGLDFAEINHVPVLRANMDVGHYPATYREPNGGAFARAGVAWLKWQLRGDAAAGKFFTDDTSGIAADPKWKVEKKKIN